MDAKAEKIIYGQEGNHILPFLWIHGESAETYRRMVKAIYDANIRAFCVEARPHKEFCREQWWRDMDVILNEAEMRGMKVWILDDKHFPTGFANGGAEKAPLELRRQNICRRQMKVRGQKTVRLNLERLIHPRNKYDVISLVMYIYAGNLRKTCRFNDDRLLSITAYGSDGVIDLTPFIEGGRLTWRAPAGDWDIEICSLSRNTGMHRSYINMMDRASCRIQIDEVYEPHYAHYKDKFGSTIAGFFSDEPELGNGNYCKHYNYLGTAQDLPFSNELTTMLEVRLGESWRNLLPLLWKNDYDKAETARVRYVYMDCVSRLAEEDFSRQIGKWCEDHGVEYIGHVIEDNNQHARTSTSLGHFFRGLKWQNMAGIDDIGGQVYPGGEDFAKKSVFGYINDGEFYHYALGKLGSSLGAITPRMQGRTMCEIFGNYGWSEGVRLEKYLIDHFVVRGVNYFVPHAFTSNPYPDKDCPPHFYAHGNNPQYRHFGELMNYTNRVCGLISGGYFDTPVAVLYHGEAEWTGKCMLMQKPARVLMDHQIDFNFIPGDVFSERDFYRTEIGRDLTVNSRRHNLLIIPYAQFITKETAQGITELLAAGAKVAFIDALPEGICTGEVLPGVVGQCSIVTLNGLLDFLEKLGLIKVKLSPPNNRIRSIHYIGNKEIYYLFNEGSEAYSGTVSLETSAPVYEYNAWHNTDRELEHQRTASGTDVEVRLEPGESLIVVVGNGNSKLLSRTLLPSGLKTELFSFRQSVCRSIDYPHFSKERDIKMLESYALTDPKFSGYIRYQTQIKLDRLSKAVLEITDAFEGVEVFVNGKSAGIQIIPTYLFDITALCKSGENELVIEVATTLERERNGPKGAAATGITGQVNLYCE